MNEYSHQHPDMMLGRMTRDGMMYEADRATERKEVRLRGLLIVFPPRTP